jgi:membrane-associated protease RseP (regulator of RpoE activity)
VGYEILKNFTVSLDYANHRMTLTDPKAFVPPAGATAIAFRSATIPVVPATLDGVAGWFMFDTGNAFYNTVSQQFLDAHKLARRFTDNVLVQSSGNIGGAIRLPIARASTLQIGPYRVRGPIFAVTNTTKGALAGSTFAGNIGSPVISRFDISLDYQKSVIYWKPNANFSRPFIGTLDGMSLYTTDSGVLTASYVNAGSPAAAAGLRAGDRIVSANGVSAKMFGQSGMAILEQRGKPIAIVYERAGVRHAATLVPKEMVP